jgi:hypothetical protein
MSILGCTFSNEPPTIQQGKGAVAGAARQIDEIRPIAAWRNCFLRFWLNRYLKTIKYLQLCHLMHKGLPTWAAQEIATYFFCPAQVRSLANVRNAQRSCALLRRRKTIIAAKAIEDAKLASESISSACYKRKESNASQLT